MRRFHVHVHVEDLDRNIAFYSAMFGAAPARHEADYAKWMLDDPALNFAISTRGATPGVDHLGIQVDSAEDLATLKNSARAADMALLDEGEVSCCYARSDKYWLTDPQGLAWEQFQTLEQMPLFGAAKTAAKTAATTAEAPACCAPRQPAGRPIAIPVKAAGSCC
ncbi:MAG TPA: ArsI/CadI family heavy metal resistance metalloenzyme [Methylibium sp.]|nr:ArsI/CadI family heavy metal resistance metalloenzyme [Methylibium sp.]